jgi:hypothetical protein
VSAFDNLDDDSSPDVHRTPPPKKTEEKRVFSPPPASDEFLRLSFVLLRQALMTALHVLPDFRPRWICHWKVWMRTWKAARGAYVLCCLRIFFVNVLPLIGHSFVGARAVGETERREGR